MSADIPPKVDDLIRTASIAGKIDAIRSSGHAMHAGVFSEADSEFIGRVFRRLTWLEEERERQRGTIAFFALEHHHAMDGDADCQGVECPAVQRLIDFGVKCAALAQREGEQTSEEVRPLSEREHNEMVGMLAKLNAPVLRTALDRLAFLERQDESAWVIEVGSGPTYYAGGECGLSGANARAVRFCRQQDAESVRAALGLTDAKVVEHLWVAAPTTPERACKPPFPNCPICHGSGTVLIDKPWKPCGCTEPVAAPATPESRQPNVAGTGGMSDV